MLRVNEELTQRVPEGIRVVIEAEKPDELMEPIVNQMAREKAAELGLNPSGIGNIPSPYAIDKHTKEPIFDNTGTVDHFRVDILCVSPIPV